MDEHVVHMTRDIVKEFLYREENKLGRSLLLSELLGFLVETENIERNFVAVLLEDAGY